MLNKKLVAAGVPPKDMIQRIVTALWRAGHDKDDVFPRATTISNEWHYNITEPHLEKRFTQRYMRERTVQQKHRTLEETLNPQPIAQRTLMKLLAWIDRVDLASQACANRPPFEDPHDGFIFPPEGHDDERWWSRALHV